MANELKQQLKGVARSLAELQDRIGGLNDRLETAHEKRHAIAIAPPTKSETIAKFAALVDHRATRYAYTFRGQVYNTFRTPLDTTKSDPVPGVGDLFTRRTFDGDAIDSDALHFFLGDLLKEKIRGEIESMEWPGPEGLPANERAAALAKLDAEIEALESEKENLFMQLREAGLSVSERDVFAPAPDDVTVIRPSPPPTVGSIAEPKGGQTPGELEQVAADLRGDRE